MNALSADEPSARTASTGSRGSLTAVEFQHTGNLVPLLNELRISLVISTYQAGKVLTVGSHGDALEIRFHHFEQAMGLARTGTGLAVGTKKQIWFLNAAPGLAPQLAPAGRYDVALLARQSQFTGAMMGHDLAWCAGELWAVNTLFSTLCVIHPEYSFVPRWQPPWISRLAAEDRCHLNGLAADAQGPRFVTSLGQTDTPAGWREDKARGGCLVDVASGAVVQDGLCMPHSPRLHEGELWLLNSGRGELNRCDLNRRQMDVVAQLPGYTRGLDCQGRYAFVGLSKIRESSVFGGLPIATSKSGLQCGVAVVDLQTGQVRATLQFLSGVEEIFDVKVLPGFLNPFVSGPFPEVDQAETVWLSPPILSSKTDVGHNVARAEPRK